MLILLGIVSLAATIIGPRRLWWALRAWSYRDPIANEPSDVAYSFERFLLAMIAAVALIAGAVTLGDPAPGSPEAEAAEYRAYRNELLCNAVMVALLDGDVQTDDRDETRDRANAVLAEFDGEVDMIRGTMVVDFSLSNGVSGTFGSAQAFEEGC